MMMMINIRMTFQIRENAATLDFHTVDCKQLGGLLIIRRAEEVKSAYAEGNLATCSCWLAFDSAESRTATFHFIPNLAFFCFG